MTSGDGLHGWDATGRMWIAVGEQVTTPGATLRAEVTVSAREEPLLLRRLEVGLVQVQRRMDHGIIAERSESWLDVGARRTLAGDVPVPPMTTWTSEVALVIPNVAATIQRSLEYALVAWAAIDHVTARASVPIVVIRPQVGDHARTTDPEGRLQRVLVVQVHGPVTLVQWPDGRPATWVASDSVFFDV